MPASLPNLAGLSVAGAAPGTIELPNAKASAYAKERGQQAAGADFNKALGDLGGVYEHVERRRPSAWRSNRRCRYYRNRVRYCV